MYMYTTQDQGQSVRVVEHRAKFSDCRQVFVCSNNENSGNDVYNKISSNHILTD